MSMSVHTPAWQRLGLKLKFAKEAANPATTPSAGHHAAVHRPRGASDSPNNTDKYPNKRRRVDDTQLAEKSNDHVVVPIASTDHHGSAQQSSIPTEDTVNDHQPRTTSNGVKRKKSVSFSTDSTPKSSSTQPAIEVSVSSSRPAIAQSVTNVMHGKKHGTSKATKLPKPKQVGTSDSSKNLAYLDTHYRSRGSWKFNKNRDIWILQHALDMEAIPATYNRALAGYVSGLPEKAASRARLIESCKESLKNVEQSNLDESNEQMKQDFMNSLESTEPMQSRPDLDEWLSEVPRAQLLAWSLRLSTEEHGVQNQRPAVKKSKARSSRVEILSSDSDSDSDGDSTSSDSDSDSDSSG